MCTINILHTTPPPLSQLLSCEERRIFCGVALRAKVYIFMRRTQPKHAAADGRTVPANAAACVCADDCQKTDTSVESTEHIYTLCRGGMDPLETEIPVPAVVKRLGEVFLKSSMYNKSTKIYNFHNFVLLQRV